MFSSIYQSLSGIPCFCAVVLSAFHFYFVASGLEPLFPFHTFPSLLKYQWYMCVWNHCIPQLVFWPPRFLSHVCSSCLLCSTSWYRFSHHSLLSRSQASCSFIISALISVAYFSFLSSVSSFCSHKHFCNSSCLFLVLSSSSVFSLHLFFLFLYVFLVLFNLSGSFNLIKFRY